LYPVAVLLFAMLVWIAGYILVIDQPERGDAIIVLGGDHNDYRYWRGLQLLQQGYGQFLLVDSNIDEVQFGRTLADQAADFVQHSAGALADRVKVCPIEGDSTVIETRAVQKCLQERRVHSVVLVTSSFHTRRALSIFRQRLPQYHWSVAAITDDSRFRPQWWQRREWAKTTFMEWTKLVWWLAVDRWWS
jgi:uncharacterized SAM-binding protein YcdF (DUF218 family)